MPASNFEAIIAGQLAPHLGTWYDFGMESSYEFLDAQSGVGKLAVELRVAAIDTAMRYDELDVLADDEPVSAMRRSKLRAADHAYQMARSRDSILDYIYQDMVAMHSAATLGYAVPGGYHGAVADAVARAVESFDGNGIPEDDQPELMALTQEIGTFLSLESDLHFIGLD